MGSKSSWHRTETPSSTSCISSSQKTSYQRYYYLTIKWGIMISSTWDSSGSTWKLNKKLPICTTTNNSRKKSNSWEKSRPTMKIWSQQLKFWRVNSRSLRRTPASTRLKMHPWRQSLLKKNTCQLTLKEFKKSAISWRKRYEKWKGQTVSSKRCNSWVLSQMPNPEVLAVQQEQASSPINPTLERWTRRIKIGVLSLRESYPSWQTKTYNLWTRMRNSKTKSRSQWSKSLLQKKKCKLA